jgi:hypothetical protein
MNVLNTFYIYIQCGCGEEMIGIVQQQLCQQVIISPHHPKNTILTQFNVTSSVAQQGCTHMPINSI